MDEVVELNVGGVLYTTARATLEGSEVLAKVTARDAQGRLFVDRDGVLFRFVLDYLRDGHLTLPDHFAERARLRAEARHFQLPLLLEALVEQGMEAPGCLTLGYRGSFAFGRDGLADVKFRKLTRILVSGRVPLCREVFGESLNESRDPDRVNENRYTSRFFLKHNFLEQAFDALQASGFRCVAGAGSGTSGAGNEPLKPGIDVEENRWNHYNEFVFVRP